MKNLTFEEFAATKKFITADHQWCVENGLCGDEELLEEQRKIVLYEENAYIFVEPDNSFSLILGNREWVDTDISKLEKILYEDYYLCW